MSDGRCSLLLACGLFALLRLLPLVAVRRTLLYALHARILSSDVALRRMGRPAGLVVALPALFAAAAILRQRQRRAGGRDDGGDGQRRLDVAKSEGQFHRVDPVACRRALACVQQVLHRPQ